jgi:uncharacterized protein (DUF362 family)
VSIARAAKPRYPKIPPYHPHEHYPEYPFQTGSREENFAYEAVRESLLLMGLDAENAGTASWNPLKDFVAPASRVVIKPNLVKHFHDKHEDFDSLLTHGSVIRAICDYVVIALGNEGRITIADTPLDVADFEEICRLNGLTGVVDFIQKNSDIEVELLDLRTERLIIDDGRTIRRTIPNPGDPEGYATVDLKESSLLHEIDGPTTNYYTLGDFSVDHLDPNERSPGEPNRYHGSGTHQYRVGRSILKADTIISAAKLKTHKKSGVTLNMKNMIGIICGKEYIPHHRPGCPPEGDAYPVQPPERWARRRRFRKRVGSVLARFRPVYNFVRFGIMANVYKILPRKEYIDWGSWVGNDTIWRTIVDINRTLLYADSDGNLHPEPQRSYFAIVDGIVGMDGEGPMGGHPQYTGLILAGTDCVACDTVGARIMGFDPAKLRLLARADEGESYRLNSSDLSKTAVYDRDGERHLNLHYVPPKGWAQAIERDE